MWSPTIVTVAKLPKRGTRTREAYVKDGLIALPPKRADKLKSWKQKMGINA